MFRNRNKTWKRFWKNKVASSDSEINMNLQKIGFKKIVKGKKKTKICPHPYRDKIREC